MFLSLVRQENLDQQQRKPSTLSQASPCSKPIPGYLFPAIFSLVTQDMIKGWVSTQELHPAQEEALQAVAQTKVYPAL